MSKRYPPIFNVILFAVAVIFMLLNPIANMIPWLPEAIKTAVTVAIYALYDFFNAAVKFIVDTYNKYVAKILKLNIIPPSKQSASINQKKLILVMKVIPR